MTAQQKEKMRDQAKLLAMESKSADPHVIKVIWFPHEKEVHIIEINDNTTPSDTVVAPFYFGPVPEEGLPAPSGIAIIKPEEYRKLDLPSGWGTWDDAEELETA
jgi:hypothetical protein